MAVKAKTGRWYPGSGSLCPVCEKPGLVESIWHLFIYCEFARRCWELIGIWDKLDGFCYEIDNTQDFFLHILSHCDREESEKVMATTWAIWRNRNQIVWEGKYGTPSQSVHAKAWSLMEWKEVWLPRLEPTRPERCRWWHRPPEGFAKVNVDAGFFAESLRMRTGLVIRNENDRSLSFRTSWREGLM